MDSRTLPTTEVPRFNFLALTAPIPPGFVRNFRRSHRAWWTARRNVTTILGSGALILLLGSSILAMVAIAVVLIMSQTVQEFSFAGSIAIAVGLGFLAVVSWCFVGVLRRDVRFGPGWARIARLNEFAHANGLVYEFERRQLYFGGSIFSLGKDAIATDVFTVASGRRIQIGNYRSFAKSIFDSAHFTGGYVVIELDRHLPHMMAIATKRRGRRRQNWAPGLIRSQRLSLEGDFDKYFTLYAPRQYERDALYVFTPDLMVLLIDRLGALDLEIVDNCLYLYSHTLFDLTNPATHEWLARVVQVVGQKATSQTRSYSDHRTDPRFDVIAPGGRRLRRGISAGAVVAIMYVALRILASVHGY